MKKRFKLFPRYNRLTMSLELFQLHKVASDAVVLLELLKDPILQARGQDFCFGFGPQTSGREVWLDSRYWRKILKKQLFWATWRERKKKKHENQSTHMEFDKIKKSNSTHPVLGPKKQLQLQSLQSSIDFQVSFVDPWQNQCQPRPHLALKVDQLV